MSDDTFESEFVHRFKNKLAIAGGFVRLLLDECTPDDPKRPDLLQVQDALNELGRMLATQTGRRK
ncbi:MAG: hypothetical protein AB7I25_14960 [Vicinamibacterales bacterium]